MALRSCAADLRYQNLLSDVLRIRYLHPPKLGDPQDDRPVDLDELLPCRPIRRIADTDEQTGTMDSGPITGSAADAAWPMPNE